MGVRTFEEECKYLEKISPVKWKIKKGFVNNMKVNLIAVFFFVKSTKLNIPGGRRILCKS